MVQNEGISNIFNINNDKGECISMPAPDAPGLLFAKKATADELVFVEKLKKDIQPAIDAYGGEDKLFPEMISEYKLLRYVRGHGNNAKNAFSSHLKYRTDRGVDQARAELMDIEEQTGQLPWPYNLSKFNDIIVNVFDNVLPAHLHKYTPKDLSPMTLTYLANYDFEKIARKGYSELWLELMMYCDVYFDIILNRRSEIVGAPVGRHDLVDVTGVRLKQFGMKTISLLRKMASSAEQYPEMIVRTTAVNASSNALAVWNFLKSLVPKQTAAKMKVLGQNYKSGFDDLGLDDTYLPARLNGTCDCKICLDHFNKNRSIVSIEKGKMEKLTLKGLKKGSTIHFDFHQQQTGKNVKKMIIKEIPDKLILTTSANCIGGELGSKISIGSTKSNKKKDKKSSGVDLMQCLIDVESCKVIEKIQDRSGKINIQEDGDYSLVMCFNSKGWFDSYEDVYVSFYNN